MRINNLGPVFVPVKDQDKSLDFYVNKLGFEKRADFPYGDGSRWIEVAPSGAANTIALVSTDEGKAMEHDAAYCAFVTEDIKAAHAALLQVGVEVDAEIARRGSARTGLIALDVTIPDPTPSQFLFRDLDGNRFLIVQPD